jgi:hypothetical protein
MQGPGRQSYQFMESKLLRQFKFQNCVEVKPAASLHRCHGTVIEPWSVRQESAPVMISKDGSFGSVSRHAHSSYFDRNMVQLK